MQLLGIILPSTVKNGFQVKHSLYERLSPVILMYLLCFVKLPTSQSWGNVTVLYVKNSASKMPILELELLELLWGLNPEILGSKFYIIAVLNDLIKDV